MRKCIITITPDERSKMNVQTGEVTNIEILEGVKALSTHLAGEVLKEYAEITGDKNLDPDKLDEYINFLRKNKL